MSHGTTTNLVNDILRYIEDAMKQAVNNAFDDAIAQAVKDAEAKRDETVAAIALKLSTWASIQDMGHTIRIEITKPEKDNL
jgi:hypothetical protein